MKRKIFINILLLLVAVYFLGTICFFSCCKGNRTTYSDDSKTHADYNINHYLDTINGHVILTTVCNKDGANFSVSVSTLELK